MSSLLIRTFFEHQPGAARGRTRFHQAVSENHIGVITGFFEEASSTWFQTQRLDKQKQLNNAAINLNTLDNEGFTPFLYAVSHEREDVLKLVLEHSKSNSSNS